MRSAVLRLPSHISRPTSRVTFLLLYFGSGSTMRCGTVPRRGIGCNSPLAPVSGYFVAATTTTRDSRHGRPSNHPTARQREGYRGIMCPGTPPVGRLSRCHAPLLSAHREWTYLRHSPGEHPTTPARYLRYSYTAVVFHRPCRPWRDTHI